MPTSDELAKHPYVRIGVWDYDTSGSSDDLGNGKFYIHNITGASRGHNSSAESSGNKGDDDFKPNAPRKRTVMVRDFENGPLRQRSIMTRSYKTRIKLEGTPSHLSSTVKLEAWFQGPGYVDERGKPQLYSKNSRPEKLKRGGDLLEINAQMRKLNQSQLLYLPKYEDGKSRNAWTSSDRSGKNSLSKECQECYENFQKSMQMIDEHHRLRTEQMNEYFSLVHGCDQYGQTFLLPQFLQALPVPAALFADDYERERTVCIDSRKPQTCWNIHRFVHHIEWSFPEKDSDGFGESSVDKDCWVSPEYFIDMKKAGLTGHAVLLCSLFIGLNIDAWICIGRVSTTVNDNFLPQRSIAGSRGSAAASSPGIKESSKRHSAEGKRWYVWVMTRESNSHNCLYRFPEGAPEREKGSVKFWESSSPSGHLCPALANRWEGIADEDAAYLDALGSKARATKKAKKVKVKNLMSVKPKEKQIDYDNSDSDEEVFVPDEIDMLSYDHGAELQDISYRGDHKVGVNQLFNSSPGIGTTWGKPNHREEMAEKRKAEEKSEAATEKELEMRRKKQSKRRKAAMAKQHSERIGWIRKNDNYERIIAEGRCNYIELYSVFNDKQLFLNVQDSLSPLQIGYDFEYGINGGWLPLFQPDSKNQTSDKADESKDPFSPSAAQSEAGKKKKTSGDTLVRPNKGILLPRCCRLVSLGPPTSKDHVAENTIHIVEELISAITNYREARNMPSRWDGNDSISRHMLRVIKCKVELEQCAKVDKNGWDITRREWRKTFPEKPPYTEMVDKKGNEFYQTMNVLVEDESEKGEKINRVIRYTKGWFLNRGKIKLKLSSIP